MWKQFSLRRNKEWVDILSKVVLDYNSTIYSLEGEEIRGGFYALDLQKVKHPDVYVVDNVLRNK